MKEGGESKKSGTVQRAPHTLPELLFGATAFRIRSGCPTPFPAHTVPYNPGFRLEVPSPLFLRKWEKVAHHL